MESHTFLGRVPGTSSVIKVETGGTAITAVDDLIRPPDLPYFISPGFIDLQVNGFAGVDFNDANLRPESLRSALQALFQTGVTRFFPTLITASESHILQCLRALTLAKAEFLGNRMAEGHAIEAFHIEGPHISPEAGPRGAHPVQHVRPPDSREFDRWQEAADGNIRLVTLSPEWQTAPEYIRHLVRCGVTASIGHTKATTDQIGAAVDAGAAMSTHLGNAAHPSLPKTDNYIWDQISEDRLTASFITDGIHIPANFFRSAIRAKGLERSVLVTDAVMPAMSKPGLYMLGQVEVELRTDGRVVLRGQDRLAGSSLRMDHAIANAMRMGALRLQEAVTMATTNPARSGRIAGRQRGLVPGEKADFVLFKLDPDSSLTVIETVVAGQVVFRNGDV